MVAGHPGESADVVRQLRIGCHVSSPSDLVSALEGASEWSTPDSAEVSEWLNEHRRDVLAEKLFAMIERTIADHGHIARAL